MADLADELQADFLDLEDDEENEEEIDENGTDALNGGVDGDVGMADEEAAALENDDDNGNKKDKLDRALDDAEDEDEAKERVNKINLRGVSDFKSIAQLWTKLRPVLEVRSPHCYQAYGKIHR